VIIDTLAQVWNRTNGTNYATNGYPTRIPQTAAPSTNLPTGGAAGDGVIYMGAQSPTGGYGNYSPYGLLLLPYGTDASTKTFSLRVLGWSVTQLNLGVPLWIPAVIADLTVTLGTAVGISGADLAATQFFGTTITANLGPTLVNSAAPNTVPPIVPDYAIWSPGSNNIASVIIRSFGYLFLEVIFTTGGSATGCNSLYKKV